MRGTLRCAKCGGDNPAAKRFCGDCGAPLTNRCPKCGAENPPGKHYCGDCGTALPAKSASPQPDAPARSAETSIRAERPEDSSALDGERKTVTALFADIRDSTELAQDLDPEEARAIIDPALKLMIEAVRRYDGYVVQSTGDGIFALFGAPLAHEDHPQRALYAALRMQEEIRRYGDRLLSRGGEPIEIRVGVNTGEVVVRSLTTGQAHVEYAPIGHTTNLAARMQAVARSGSVVVSESTRRLVEGYFSLRAIGPTRLKGLSEPVPVYEVTGLGPLRTRLQASARRGLTRFVGRDSELAQMKRAFELANAGRGQILAAIGEPGVGKSRLVYEFKALSQSACMLLEALSVSHDKASAYLPLLDLLHGYFGIEARDDGRKRREKVTGRVVELDRNLEDTLPYLFALLGIAEGDDALAQMDAQVKKRRTLEAIKRILLPESLKQPLIVVFEDLHWIDQQTQEFLNLFADSIGTAKILLLVNYRPEYSHQWNNKTYYAQLRLDPLGRDDAEQMLDALLSAPVAPPSGPLARSETLPLARSFAGEGKGEGAASGEGGDLTALKRLIIERTEGTPFFMEEMVQALFEDGTLVGNGVVKVARPLTQIKVPATVQAVLASRIDRLPAQEKELLHTLAVLGREFPLGLVRRVTYDSDDELEAMLSRLQAGEFVYEQPAFPEPEYIFKHALTQEVAYNSLLIERRKQLHESAAQALESIYAEHPNDHLSELAHHYSRSGNTSKAIEYLRRASERAIERSANAEAIAQLRAALDLLKKLPDGLAPDRQETSFQLALGGVLAIATNPGNPEVERAFSRARELSVRVKDDAQLFHALAGLWFRRQILGELEDSLEVAEQLLALALRVDDLVELKFAHSAMAQSLLYLGDLVLSAQHIVQSERIICEEHRAASYHIGDAPSRWLAISASAFWLFGYPDQALARSRESLALADKLSHGYVSNVTRLFCGYFCANCRRIRDALDHAEATIPRAVEYGFSTALPQLLVQRGWALVHLGRIDEGFDQISRGTAILPPEAQGLRHLFRRLLIDAYLQAERREDGLRAVTEGLEDLQRGKRRMDTAELRRLKGELLLLRDAGAPAEAESCFREAVEIAQRQQAKSWQLRATMSLARLLRDTDRRDEARRMLSGIYGWFTEGFDTADLKDAKALLDELGD
jgi:class 3 adenylate cyclase